jgi:hypothetical protein
MLESTKMNSIQIMIEGRRKRRRRGRRRRSVEVKNGSHDTTPDS